MEPLNMVAYIQEHNLDGYINLSMAEIIDHTVFKINKSNATQEQKN